MPDDPLSEYRSRRDFEETSEPSPEDGAEQAARRRWVVQKHDAGSLHYDLRLEVDGVLKSWAVPKGPSTDPSEQRFATPTEDHPVEYLDFEGVIPEDEYGGGTVLVWDTGTYENRTGDDDRTPMVDAIAEGHVVVWLEGQKISGGYALVRTDEERWLLVKMDDADADARRNPTSTEPKSVLSGRDLDEVAAETS